MTRNAKYVVLTKPVRREGVVEIDQRELASRLAKAMGVKWPTTSNSERMNVYRLAEIATDYADEACERAGVRYS
ncbi:hypothetical protein QY049_03975 [Bradyrhizobium sp. WYCCWR 13022]|uniref:hypothetical protein n=1 Tax=unclassified Bradyrhizobium TaxID=2631580 RepID=UPI00263AE22B|nr:hypothetical protein [Bradyrhizobium sp. WYCCWR 13022]MDN4982381.1 hypothetical protein [Bradyrhizobium sp. WYCCWR 13022]